MQVSKLIYKNLLWRGVFYFTSLLVNIAIARMLGAGLSGELYFFLNNIYLALLIGSLSLDAGITYYVSKKRVSENTLATFSLVWSVLVSLLIAILFFFFYYSGPAIFQSFYLFFACSCFALGNFLTIYFTAFFYSYDDYKTPNLVSAVFNLILLTCIPWQQNWLGFIDIKTFLMIFFIANLAQGLVVGGLWFLKSRDSLALSLQGIKSIAPAIKYSVAALAGNVAYFILYRIDYWFVEYYCSAKSLGNYIQVSRLGQLLILPSAIIAGALFPQASKDNISFQAASFGKLARTIIICYLLAMFFIFLFGKSLIIFLWGNEYDEMFEPLVITMPGIIFLAVSYLFSPVFAGKGKVNYNVLISVLTLVAVVIFNFLFVPVWGIKGAAFATSLGFMAMMILYIIIANRKFGFKLKFFSDTL